MEFRTVQKESPRPHPTFLVLFLAMVGILFCSYPIAEAAVTSDAYRLWPCGLIPYQYGSGMTDADRGLFENATVDWARYANLKFIQIPDGVTPTYSTYVIVQRKAGCHPLTHGCDNVAGEVTTVGMGAVSDGPSVLTLYSSDYATVLHEVGHVLGLDHEHSRSDAVIENHRLVIDTSLMIPNYDPLQLRILGNQIPLSEYDPLSIMHLPCRCLDERGISS